MGEEEGRPGVGAQLEADPRFNRLTLVPTASHQPDVPQPMMLNFPFLAWATRRKEMDEAVSDDEAMDVLG